MTVKEVKNDLITTLTPQYGEGEARAMCRYVFDDYFGTQSDSETFLPFLLEDLDKIKQRLLQSEPVQYVVGFAWFYGFKFKVNNNVLIPRPETEELVEWILTHKKAQTSVLDIGTGSGCIPVTLKVKKPQWTIAAVDVSEGALITASRNAYRLNADVDFKRLDILNEKEWTQLGTFDIIVSNPPYIPQFEKTLMAKNVLDFEPAVALFVEDENALIFYEQIADFALTHLNTEGALFFECNEFNAYEVATLLKTKGFTDIELRKDMSGKDRMIKAKL
ncbi:MAG: peptide chain release factor N(5)-glutamine methyltransferase [Saprospiraceae bacterium]|nr:peptide chain release factor N(5)-glutamine methyltransferase [Saprospiraceae bacterium]